MHTHTHTIHAQVPIIKTELLLSGPSGRGPPTRLPADISIGAANGAAAVALVQRAVAALPALRPLCLVAKVGWWRGWGFVGQIGGV